MSTSKSSKFQSTIVAVMMLTGITLGAASIVVSETARFEGEVLEGYLDPVGIPTKCYGDTRNVVVGRKYTQSECLQSLGEQVTAHVKAVLKCAPGVESSDHMTAAFSLLTYNIGEGAFCRSTVAKRYKAGDYEGACRAITMWDKAGGRVIRGLVVRRAEEEALCLQGVSAMRAVAEGAR